MAKMKKSPPRPTYAPAPHLIFDGDTANTARYEDVYYLETVGEIQGATERGMQCFHFASAGKVDLSVEVWSSDVIRIRYEVDPEDRNFSYARSPGVKPVPTEITRRETKRFREIATPTTSVRISKEDGTIRISDRATKTVLHEYAEPFSARTTLNKGLEQVRVQFKTDEKEGFFGLGDKSWDTDLQGREFENYNSDSFGYGRERSALYRTIPFFYGLREGHAYGMFLDNPYRSFFDFNSYGDDTVNVWADGGAYDYYFINGPGLTEVAARYLDLTGRPELPPLWGLGFHQCRWSYYPEKRVRELAKTFRDKAIPCDAIYLDIDYMDGYRCFTWNKDYFPDPKGMIGDLKKDGFHTVVMIDPGIRVDPEYKVYNNGTEQDVWCKRPSGVPMVGPVWPPECVWPDYTDPEVRDWWGPLYRELYVEQGVSGFWNDMNEPAVFKVNSLTFPEDIRHDYDGQGADHKKAHNIYGMQMTRASYDGLKQLQPAKRPFLLGRASFSGGQRFAALWTGDNIASWEHLSMANRQCIRLAISGYSYVGTDIGGFVDNPDAELLTRWLQLAVFHPLMRIHSMGNNTDGAAEAEADEVKKAEEENRQDQEPWVHGGAHTKRNRMAIEMRYQLLPYLYTAFRQHLEHGIPVLRNLFFYDQQDPKCREFGDQFLFGDDLLVCPVVKAKTKKMDVYLPKGKWYDFWSGEVMKTGKYSVKVSADRLPIYVRAGAVLPTVDPVQHTGELQQLKTLHLSLFAAPKGAGELFWDAGDGYGYQLDQYCRKQYRFTKKGRRIVLRQESEGQFRSSFQQTTIRLIGLSHPPSSVKVDGKKMGHAIRYNKRSISVVVPFDFGEVVIE